MGEIRHATHRIFYQAPATNYLSRRPAFITGAAGLGFRLSLALNILGTDLDKAGAEVQNVAKRVSEFSLQLKQVGRLIEEDRSIASESAIRTVINIQSQSDALFEEIKSMFGVEQRRDSAGNLQSIRAPPLAARGLEYGSRKYRLPYLLGQLDHLKLHLSPVLQILELGKMLATAYKGQTKTPFTQKAMMQERAEIQNFILVLHHSQLALDNLYHLAEKEARGEPTSPRHEDAPPRYDTIQHTESDVKLSIEAAPNGDDKSRALVSYQGKALHELDDSLHQALSLENKTISADVPDVVDYLLEEWTKLPDPDYIRPRFLANPRSRQTDHRHATRVESDDEDSSDSEFERSENVGGFYLEGPRNAVKKNVRFRARVEDDTDEEDGQKRHRTSRRHIIHSDDESSSDSSVSPLRHTPPRERERRSSSSNTARYEPNNQPSTSRTPRPYGTGAMNTGPENSSGRPVSRGMSQASMPPRPMPNPNQKWQGVPSAPNLRPVSYNGPPGPPPRLPSGGPYVPQQYMGHSPQTPTGAYFPRQPGPPGPPPKSNSHKGPPRPRTHRNETKHTPHKDQARENASKNIKKGLFGGAAVAGILELLQGLDGI